MIQGCRKQVDSQVERKEGYELQYVMAIVIGCQWDGATLALKSQQPVMDFQRAGNKGCRKQL